MNALRTAMKNLKVAPKVNKAELKETVTKAEAISEDTLNKAVKKARDAFGKALEEAKAVLENKDASQEDVNEAAKKLEDAIKGLDVLKGDTAALDAKLAEIEKLDEKKYTADSWAALMAAVEEAKGLDAEKPSEKPETKPEVKPEEKPATKPEDKKDDTVKTGDPTSLFGLVSAMALSLAGYVSVKKKKD